MKVKCIYNNVNDLPNYLVGKDKTCKENSSFHLKINKEYIVYAMTVMDDIVWYYICDEDYSTFPVLVPCPLFEVVDKKISRYWIFNCTPIHNYTDFNCEWSFPEWANDIYFYNKLVEWEKTEEDLFAYYKQKMDLEFPNPTIKEFAEIGDREWLMCPKCIDAWHWPSDRDALVVCPKCNTTYNNPRYHPSFGQ